MAQNDFLMRLRVVKAESACRLLKRFRIQNMPAEPWLHYVDYGDTLIAYIWDTREIVYAYYFGDDRQAAYIRGEFSKGSNPWDNHESLKDPSGLLKNLPEQARNKVKHLL